MKRLASSLLLFTTIITTAQDRLWSDLPTARATQLPGERRIVPERARTLRLDTEGLRSFLATVPVGELSEVAGAASALQLPLPEGGFAAFRILEVPVMHPELQARYPMIRSYTGVGLEDGALLKMDFTPHGFHAMVLSPTGDWFIDPLVHGDLAHYQSYLKRDFRKQLEPGFQACHYDEVNDIDAAQKQTREWIAQMGADRVGDCQLRRYDLALACTGEYANYHGSNTTNNNKAFAAAAMVTSLNRVNGIYERDATLTMLLVANNDNIIYLNGATDPYTNNNGSTMLGQNISTCNSVIGSANYDIGHVFSTGGGGVAYLNSPCTSNKAGGVTGQSAPVGDPFDIDYVAHEMGHQYGGNHSQNNNCNRAASAAVEVGSGITVMGYAGICAPDVASNSIAMFGGYSMQEIAANITTGASSGCPTTTALANAQPTANAGVDRVIPRSTPFILTGIATDANPGNALTYSWEQMDNAVAPQPPVATNTGGPAWVPLLPQSTPVRYMPNLPAVIANTAPTWEVLSSVARTYTFRFTVRDNAVGGGCAKQDNMIVTVNGTAGPFVVTAPNTAVTWNALTSQTVTWDVAGTTAAPVSCANVDILLSTDGGLTYPIALATATPNDGSQIITVPNNPSTTARVMVRANGNIFYDISNTNFTIAVPAVPDYTLSVTSSTANACQPGNATYAVQVGSLLGYSSAVTLGTTGLAGGLSASFSPNPVTPGGSSTLTISGTGNVAPGNYNFTLTATSAIGTKSLPLTLQVLASAGTVTLLTPANGASGVSGGTPLTWNADANATSYAIQIATDAGMSNIVETGNGLTATSYNTAVATQPLTTYYWRVQSSNACGFGTPSAIWSYTTSDCQTVAIRIVLDRYGAETTWNLQGSGGNVVASGGPYTSQATNGTYPQPDVNLCLPTGCYTLTVNDSFGDGLCCQYGSGYIAVLDASNMPLTTPISTFTSTANASFCLGAPCVSALPYSESFSSGLGAWVQGATDYFNWSLGSGNTPTSNTGPTGDHTTGTGNYLFTESSSPNNPARLAELYGPCIDLEPFGSAELTFWYHMWGTAMGSLHVDVWNGSAWATSLWSRTGNQGNSWQQGTLSLNAYVGGTVRIRFRGITGTGATSDMAIDDILITGTNEVQVAARVALEGPYNPATGLMNDNLRTLPSFPLTEPFTALGYAHVGGGGESVAAPVLASTGGNAIVDWAVVELRSSVNPATIVATRSALVQRDGDVVATDGISPVSFPVAPGNHHVALRHRNHLGAMTAAPVMLSASSTAVDFRLAGLATYGTDARKSITGTFPVQALWAGDATFNGELKYVGEFNDRDPILLRIGGTVPTNAVAGYYPEDVNLDGAVKYVGDGNDRDPILQNIGGSVPTNTRGAQVP
ncbi:MAG TPA: zinc-dependent metalloprotease family protein [Flavobacteriales bacterium]|nr:zinc-dependent metalloprotease family protein [Flavobacteriales bacterium]